MNQLSFAESANLANRYVEYQIKKSGIESISHSVLACTVIAGGATGGFIL